MSFVTNALLHLGFSGQAGFYYRNWEHSLTNAQKPLTYTFGLILAFSIAYLAYSLYRKWFSQEPALFSSNNQAEILTIFQQAVTKRATHEIQFQSEEGQRALFFCSPVGLETSKGILLEISDYIHPQESWIGREVHCHFKLASKQKDNKWSFYQFSSAITGIRQEGALEFIIVALPKHLEYKQRRQHLRLAPPSEDIPGVSIWPETLSHLDHPGDQPPLLSFVHGRPDNQLNVLNISAGGLLLEVRSTARNIPENSLDKGNRLFVGLLLRDPGQSAVQEYLLLARVRNAFTDPASGSWLIGLSFSAHHAPQGEDSTKKLWVPLHGKGLEAIEDWVFKRHLQMYRQKGIV